MSATAFRTLDDIDVTGRRVLVRLNLNVPMKDGKIAEYRVTMELTFILEG